MNKEEIMKSIDDICERLRRSTREANEALSKIRGSVGKVSEYNEVKNWDLICEEKKEEGRYECFKLMEKLARMSAKEMKKYFDCHLMETIVREFTLEGIENGIKQWESEQKLESKSEVKRGDIVDIIDRSNCSIVAEDAIYVDRGQNFWVVVLDGFIVTSKYDMDKYTLIGTEKVKESED